MSRPEVSVVMPFAGGPAAARAAVDSLRALDTSAGDELILVDNSGAGTLAQLQPEAADPVAGQPVLSVVSAPGERSPAHARNVGAARAGNDWILFLDADVRPLEGLLGAFFNGGIGEDVGAVAGEVLAAPDGATLAARYGAARSFLGQRAHHEHPYRPRAAAANLLVRRVTFEQLGGFYEGVRAAEDTDFTWRLQEAGWRLALCGEARVEHQYRTTVSELRRQWRGYAAGRAWLGRRYDGFEPQPAVRRAVGRLGGRGRAGRVRADGRSPGARRGAPPVAAGRLERARFAALDALLAFEELAGLSLSNRPSIKHLDRPTRADVVLVADRFPARDDPLVELAETIERARVEAVARPEAPDLAFRRRHAVDYLEDDGTATRLIAAGLLALRHPLRCGHDLLLRAPDAPPLRSLAPAVRRLERDVDARVHALGSGNSRALAERLARLAGRSLDR
jgi:GT2 family glycosyltransferase